MSKRRLIHKAVHTSGSGTTHTAKVYRDSEWNEFVVVFSVDSHILNKSDYHTSDKQDATDTADYHIQRVAKQFA